jgi:exonuclease VII small subunit
MSKLELTQKRLTQALESLEKAAKLAAQRGSHASAAETQIASLTEERERIGGAFERNPGSRRTAGWRYRRNPRRAGEVT